MGFVAIKRLRWGDDHIEPGQVVPPDEVGRNYRGMLQRGEISATPDPDKNVRGPLGELDSSRAPEKRGPGRPRKTPKTADELTQDLKKDELVAVAEEAGVEVKANDTKVDIAEKVVDAGDE